MTTPNASIAETISKTNKILRESLVTVTSTLRELHSSYEQAEKNLIKLNTLVEKHHSIVSRQYNHLKALSATKTENRIRQSSTTEIVPADSPTGSNSKNPTNDSPQP